MKRVVYVLTAAGQGFMRNPTMSLASTFTVALMLTLFAFFLTTDRGLQATVAVLEGKVELATFIEAFPVGLVITLVSADDRAFENHART